jgi:nicotinate-nucleotide adenylyltransferase
MARARRALRRKTVTSDSALAAPSRPACASACRRQLQPGRDGHRLASLTALRRLQLDRVWWLVTPGNPLKDNARLPSLAERIHQAENVAGHTRIDVTGVEAMLRTRYTADAARLKRRCPGVNFVWIMGSTISPVAPLERMARMRMMPIAIIDRPGSTHSAMASPAANWLSRWRLPEPGREPAAHAALRPGLPAWQALDVILDDAAAGRPAAIELRRLPAYFRPIAPHAHQDREDTSLTRQTLGEAEPKPLPQAAVADNPSADSITSPCVFSRT